MGRRALTAQEKAERQRQRQEALRAKQTLELARECALDPHLRVVVDRALPASTASQTITAAIVRPHANEDDSSVDLLARETYAALRSSEPPNSPGQSTAHLPDLRDMSDPEANKLEEPPAGRAAPDERRDATINRRAAIELRAAPGGRATKVEARQEKAMPAGEGPRRLRRIHLHRGRQMRLLHAAYRDNARPRASPWQEGVAAHQRCASLESMQAPDIFYGKGADRLLRRSGGRAAIAIIVTSDRERRASAIARGGKLFDDLKADIIQASHDLDSKPRLYRASKCHAPTGALAHTYRFRYPPCKGCATPRSYHHTHYHQSTDPADIATK
ncbi:hypothetical protein AU210_016787 [Fusarium oxysporum f. sp. radicis-cucumerinum]|uniref:Uncharacterized protein n=1 Tax=Fusarium oxysporum f. sp. radicis-cucumerinum TaxID=327505 RepID=A0A2H3G5E9_FUSOX|nr:hypothetical protein AU210_016787 [Fusarium oxysporum f. sp. radicis-cucumerinum]